MREADSKHKPSRRTFLGRLTGGAAVVAVAASASTIAHAAPAPQPGNPDAELIALCAEFDAIEREMMAAYDLFSEDQEDELWEYLKPFHERMDGVMDRITVYRITTLAGFQAVARTALLSVPDALEFLEEPYFLDRFLRTIFVGLTGIEPAAVAS